MLGLGAGKSVTGIRTLGADDHSETSPKAMGYSEASFGKYEDMPSPLIIEQFVPWICKEMCLHVVVVVTKHTMEDYMPAYLKRKSRGKKLDKSKAVDGVEQEGPPSTEVKPAAFAKQKLDSIFEYSDTVVYMKANYDHRGKLIEISFNGSNHISQKLIKAINVCIPVHSYLTKLSITNCTLKQEPIYEIGELLPFCSITDVCLDHTYVRQGNYYVLLNHNSKLKRLSLNRCRINDAIIEEIFNRLDFDEPVSRTLQVLELSSNFITDLGAYIIAKNLKRNRSLLHLNLAGNRITDDGAILLLEKLMTFPLTESDNADRSRRRRSYYNTKAKVYARCYQEQLKKQKKIDEHHLHEVQQQRSKSISGHLRVPTKGVKAKSAKSLIKDIKEVAETLSTQLMGGPFKDPYDDSNTVREDGKILCKGNFKLCSLNLAYNELEMFSMLKLLEVIKYQSFSEKPADHSGLLHVVIDGNNLPVSCPELEWIDAYMKKTLSEKGRRQATRMTSRETAGSQSHH